jgi:hypothetical protein
MLTVEEIGRALKNHTWGEEGAKPGAYSWGYWCEIEGDEAGENVPGVGTVKVLEDFGGEGQGEIRYYIFEITDLEGEIKLYKKDGYYASFHGTDWDGGFYEVVAREKVITVYERS